MDDVDLSRWGVPALAMSASAVVSSWYRRRHGWRRWPVIWKTIRVRETGRRTGSFAMPATLFYGKDGRLLLRHMGERDRDGIDQRLKMLAASGTGHPR
ncbi:hypothetical protein IM543_07040 [Massilia sp. UMI-21]|nr:hypothetical protein IM543_07040 [Massilia sp. UMI-21]